MKQIKLGGSCLFVALSVMACQTTAKVTDDPIVIATPDTQGCYNISSLKKVEIPAVTETYYGITEIDNYPYAPIERKEKLTRVIEEARIIYVDSNGEEVIDICPEETPAP